MKMASVDKAYMRLSINDDDVSVSQYLQHIETRS